MPLQGSLGHLGLADLLQTGLTGSQGGYLRLSNGAERALLFVGEEGLQLLEPDVLDPNDVLDAFLRRGVLTNETIRAQGRVANLGGMALLDQLLKEGALEEADLYEVLAGVAEDTILDLLTWEHGTFRFEEGHLDPGRVGLVGRITVDAGGVLLRAAQRVDERHAIARDLGLRAALFVPTGNPGPEREEEEDLSPEVLAALDGSAIVDEIALQLGVGRFRVLKAAHVLCAAGAARAATAEELAWQSVERADRGQLRAARALCLHWNELQPAEPGPLQMLVDVASRRGSLEEELAATCALGTLLLQSHRPDDALDVFRAGLRKTPFHEDLLQGVRLSAQAVRDDSAYAEATLKLAEHTIEGGDADRALFLVRELLKVAPDHVEGHAIQGRAASKQNDKDALVQAAERVLALIEGRKPTRREREAAVFFRDALARMAPERSDLMRRFKGLATGSKAERRIPKPALALALLVLIATAGIVLWPQGPSGVLSDAQAAIERGDREVASQLLTELIERWPDAPEAEEAFRLQTQHFAPQTGGTRRVAQTPVRASVLDGHVAAFRAALPTLPDAASRDAVEKALLAIEKASHEPTRKRLLKEAQSELIPVLHRLDREARRRGDHLGRADAVLRNQGRNADALRSFLAEADTLRDAAWVEDLEAAQSVLDRLLPLTPGPALLTSLRAFDETVQKARRALTAHDPDLDKLARALISLDLDAAYETAKAEGPRTLARGDLARAAALYEAVWTLLQRIQTEDQFEPLRDRPQRERIEAYVASRRDRVRVVQDAVATAKAHEAADRIEEAVTTWQGIFKEHWQIPLTTLVEIPIRVITHPTGAEVRRGDEVLGTTPCTVRYVPGVKTGITLVAQGHAEVTRTLGGLPKTLPESFTLPHTLDVTLPPKEQWRRDIAPGVRPTLQAVGLDVLAWDRKGHLALHAADDGHERWARQVSSLEGVRGAPAVVGDLIHVPCVDGELRILDRATGNERGTVRMPRPHGDAATVDRTVAVMGTRGALTLVRNSGIHRTVTLDLAPTAGVLGAHGHFWIGGASGGLARVTPDGQATTIDLPGAKAPVRGLTATSSGVLAVAGDGRLFALDRRGGVQWHRNGLGDLVGRAAEAAGVVAVVDRRGRLHRFDATRGNPQGILELGATPRDGARGGNGYLLVALENGALVGVDARSGTVRLRVQAPGEFDAPPEVVGNEHVAVAVNDCCIQLFVLPPR